MDRYLRVFKFTFQVWSMARQNGTLLKPMIYNLVVAVPCMAVLSFLLGMTESENVAYFLLAVGITLLYFIDYFCAGRTASLIYEQVTHGNASFENAKKRTWAARGGILTFAAISALLDILSSYAQERSDWLGRLLTSILYSIWTTATFVVMPSMVIESVSFTAAFSRSKAMMKQDPTSVGTGVPGS